MYIKRLEIVNFQKHSELSLDFVNGVNILSGNSRAGKSCIRRALAWLIFNQNIDKIRKEGTKSTSVKAYFSNEVILERVRSQSVNRYILTINDVTKEFDAIGKDIPEEIKQVLNLPMIEIDKDSINLNISDQIALPFLLDKSGTFRMKLFNLLTGNELQDKLLGSFNKSILNLNKNLKTQKELLSSYQKDLTVIQENKEKSRQILNVFKVKYEQIKKNQKTLEVLELLNSNLKNNEEKKEFINFQLKNLKNYDLSKIEELNNNIIKYNTFILLLNANIDNKNKKAYIDHTLLKSPILDTVLFKIEVIIRSYETFKEIKNKNQEITLKIKQLQSDLDKLEIRFEQLELDYLNMLKTFKKCPICEAELTEECLKKVKL